MTRTKVVYAKCLSFHTMNPYKFLGVPEMNRSISYFLIAIAAFFTGVAVASGTDVSQASTANHILSAIHESHSQAQAY